ncbi:hypothetical protein ACHQM5_023143 [Ranunculus cassubicifolius]
MVHSSEDHASLERKRREKLNHQFIALSTIFPGQKKKDKASLLGDLTKYIKELQQRVKKLEDKSSVKPMESAVFVKRSDESSSELFDETLPEISTKISGRDVLVGIHCENKKGILVNTLEEFGRLNLSIVTSRSIAFGTSTLDITVISKMEDGFNMTANNLVHSLRLSIPNS